jgi:undecaprenyl-diphosphatase
MPLAVAWARMYQGMHFPSDVAVSLVFATLWLAACWWAFEPGARGQAIRFGSRPATDDAVPAAEGAPPQERVSL